MPQEVICIHTHFGVPDDTQSGWSKKFKRTFAYLVRKLVTCKFCSRLLIILSLTLLGCGTAPHQYHYFLVDEEERYGNVTELRQLVTDINSSLTELRNWALESPPDKPVTPPAGSKPAPPDTSFSDVPQIKTQEQARRFVKILSKPELIKLEHYASQYLRYYLDQYSAPADWNLAIDNKIALTTSVELFRKQVEKLQAKGDLDSLIKEYEQIVSQYLQTSNSLESSIQEFQTKIAALQSNISEEQKQILLSLEKAVNNIKMELVCSRKSDWGRQVLPLKSRVQVFKYQIKYLKDFAKTKVKNISWREEQLYLLAKLEQLLDKYEDVGQEYITLIDQFKKSSISPEDDNLSVDSLAYIQARRCLFELRDLAEIICSKIATASYPTQRLGDGRYYGVRSPYDILRPDGLVTKHDPFFIVLNHIYLPENGDWWTDYLGVPFGISPKGEIAVVAIIDDGRTTQPLQILVHFQKFVPDESMLAFNSLLVYANSNAECSSVKISLWVYDIDEQERTVYTKLLSSASTLASSIPNGWGQAFAILGQLGKTIVEHNEDDLLFRFDFQLYPAPNSDQKSCLGSPVLQEGNIGLVGVNDPKLFAKGYEHFVMSKNWYFCRKGTNHYNAPTLLTDCPHAMLTVRKWNLGLDGTKIQERAKAFDNYIRNMSPYKNSTGAPPAFISTVDLAINYLLEINPKEEKSALLKLSLAFSDPLLNDATKTLLSEKMRNSLIPGDEVSRAAISKAVEAKTQKAWLEFLTNSVYKFSYDSKTDKIKVVSIPPDKSKANADK